MGDELYWVLERSDHLYDAETARQEMNRDLGLNYTAEQFHDLLTDLGVSVTEPPEPQKSIRPLPDGPSGLFGFVLSGREIEAKRKTRRLLELLWRKGIVSQQEVLDHVYGHDADEKENALGCMVYKLNERFEKHGIKRRISLAEGKVALLKSD